MICTLVGRWSWGVRVYHTRFSSFDACTVAASSQWVDRILFDDETILHRPYVWCQSFPTGFWGSDFIHDGEADPFDR